MDWAGSGWVQNVQFLLDSVGFGQNSKFHDLFCNLHNYTISGAACIANLLADKDSYNYFISTNNICY